jgi:hypothetical protein
VKYVHGLKRKLEEQGPDVVEIDAGGKDLQQAQNVGDHEQMGEEPEVDQTEVD